MAEEKDFENIEEQEDKSSRRKLIFSIIIFILVMILLIMGIVLFVIIQNNNEGQINIEGSNVHIQATARVEGAAVLVDLPPIYINSNSEDSVVRNWDNVNLYFDKTHTEISLYITIVNYNEMSGLSILYDNASQSNNLEIENYYYLNQSQQLNPIINQDPIYISAGESITFLARFSLIDQLLSFENRLDINISCQSYEE